MLDSKLRNFVEARTTIKRNGNIEKFSFSPGNGYMYEIFVIPVFEQLGGGVMGSIEEGYLVVNAFTGMSYLFSLGGIIMNYYVAKHLFHQEHPSEQNVNAVTAVLAYALDREADAEVEKMNVEYDTSVA